MIWKCLPLAVLILAIAAASAHSAPRDASKRAHAARSLDAVAKLCRETAYRNIQGRGRDKMISLYFDECLKRGGPF